MYVVCRGCVERNEEAVAASYNVDDDDDDENMESMSRHPHTCV